MNYQFVDGGDVMEVCGIALDRGAVILDASVLVLLSRPPNLGRTLR
ncbi:hypothetical protein PC116_g7978 [Phytophthora cactorum]|uniref:Uncharacterized protein n=1 Tax=Phytophthora cactorum TaxID=29920 RepID=A0A8T1LAC1_9STRA|nr:hypothetical protein Pcac1_g18186 [Phytophthora cactorum]KAG2842328.1 hypothetical protein PC112_g3058 [Phytophthora cactorum]KAG2922715.1 hypothetical protein PC114_g5145 [Phytophthora cactorum]KAG2947155.1 hypothetical protein PC117_g7018 [Phytophthora cactorum]KAG2989510.1 hypothetical protein PC118_g6137 [Phytophthora cactorum]